MNKLSQLTKETRLYFLDALRLIIPKQFPDLVKECGLEKSEELIIEMLENDSIQLCVDYEHKFMWFENLRDEIC